VLRADGGRPAALFFCAWRQVIMPTQRLLCGW
jgi:hypothetical protein